MPFGILAVTGYPLVAFIYRYILFLSRFLHVTVSVSVVIPIAYAVQ